MTPKSATILLLAALALGAGATPAEAQAWPATEF
jgi:hypothetical protein